MGIPANLSRGLAIPTNSVSAPGGVKTPGVPYYMEDILIDRVDGLNGFKEVIQSVFSQA